MDIEDLSKAQLLLLMILVNFVTSIATGVLTVSLLDEAPQTVTQTVNQIVDRTIETVATGTPLATAVATPPTTITKTVIETDDQLLQSAVEAENDRTVGIYSSTGTTTPLIAYGTYLPKAGAVVTATTATLPTEVVISFPDGSIEQASLSHSGATLTIYGFSDSAKLPVAPAPNLIPEASVNQGETVVSLTADGSAVTGIVSKIDDSGIETNLPLTPAGTAAVDLSGDIVGISSGTAGVYFPADKITTLLTATTTTLSS